MSIKELVYIIIYYIYHLNCFTSLSNDEEEECLRAILQQVYSRNGTSMSMKINLLTCT